MKKKIPMPTAPLAAVRADTSIADCVKLMRDKSIGSLVIVSANAKEEIVGIFTERDLVKNIELIHRGNFWDNPVRTVMTSPVRTISVDRLEDAPRIMSRYNIRHLPIVAEGKNRNRIVGVLSMRDLFRFAMEQMEYDFSRILYPSEPTAEKVDRKMIGVFSADKNVRELIDQSMKLTRHLMVKAQGFGQDITSLESRFEALIVDLDGMPPLSLAKFLARARNFTSKRPVFVIFSPPNLTNETVQTLHKLYESRRIHLVAKPLSVGLFYEKVLKIL